MCTRSRIGRVLLLVVAVSLAGAKVPAPARAAGVPPAADRMDPASISVTSTTVTPSADAFVCEVWPNDNYGAVNALIVGYGICPGSESGGEMRSLIKFDLSSIPSGHVIQSASLQLRLSQYEGAGVSTVALRRMRKDWSESTVTWAKADDVDPDRSTIGVGTKLGDYTWDATVLVGQ